MDLGEGYRWNVPVVTYGFEQSFLDYFGSNGVTAVEQAIQILNDLPPASELNPDAFALNTIHDNHRAEAQGLLDLKSAVMGLLLEQMGLASPGRYAFCLREFINPTNYTVIMRNFDPISLLPSDTVNDVMYYGAFTYFIPNGPGIVYSVPVDPAVIPYDAVADYLWGAQYPGYHYKGLTRDDVGGLRYLYGTNNIAFENLIPDVRGAGRNKNHYVKSALRPGVDKITFQRMDYDPSSGRFVATTNRYEDTYVRNGRLRHQTLERVITEPDIKFTARDSGVAGVTRSGTSNWVNNGLPGHDGPGVIQPPVFINFNPVGASLVHWYPGYPSEYIGQYFPFWGSYDATTNVPIVYPIAAPPTNTTQVDLWLVSTDSSTDRHFLWELGGIRNDVFDFQTSADLSTWLTIAKVTNSGWGFKYLDLTHTYAWPGDAQRFYRAIPRAQ